MLFLPFPKVLKTSFHFKLSLKVRVIELAYGCVYGTNLDRVSIVIRRRMISLLLLPRVNDHLLSTLKVLSLVNEFHDKTRF